MASASASSAASSGLSDETLEDGKIEVPASRKTAQQTVMARRKSSLLAPDDRIKQHQNSEGVSFAEESTKSIDIVLANGYVHHTDEPTAGIIPKVQVQPAYELKPGVGVQYCA
jgi:hypothetical protein